MMKYLIETDFIGNRAGTLSQEKILSVWDETAGPFIWLEKGELKTGGIRQFLDFKEAALEESRTGGIRKGTQFNLDRYRELGADAVMTASAAMAVLEETGAEAVVTAAISGFYPEMLEDNGEILWTRSQGPPDIASLTACKSVLIAGGIPAVFDRPGTYRFLRERGVDVCMAEASSENGFMSEEEPIELPAFSKNPIQAGRPTLMINPLPSDLRIKERRIFDRSREAALASERLGSSFLDAYAQSLNLMTQGYTGLLLVNTLLKNAYLAESLNGIS